MAMSWLSRFPVPSFFIAGVFHCWRGDDRGNARYILESICVKGLHLTTNAATLDSFAIDRGNGIVQMEVQHPPVCFTDATAFYLKKM
jgi:hypothetical protein